MLAVLAAAQISFAAAQLDQISFNAVREINSKCGYLNCIDCFDGKCTECSDDNLPIQITVQDNEGTFTRSLCTAKDKPYGGIGCLEETLAGCTKCSNSKLQKLDASGFTYCAEKGENVYGTQLTGADLEQKCTQNVTGNSYNETSGGTYREYEYRSYSGYCQDPVSYWTRSERYTSHQNTIYNSGYGSRVYVSSEGQNLYGVTSRGRFNNFDAKQGRNIYTFNYQGRLTASYLDTQGSKWLYNSFGSSYIAQYYDTRNYDQVNTPYSRPSSGYSSWYTNLNGRVDTGYRSWYYKWSANKYSVSNLLKPKKQDYTLYVEDMSGNGI